MRLTATFITAVSTILAFFAFSLPSAESEMQDLVLPVEVMHYDVFGEIEGNSELPFYGGNSPRYVKEVTFDVNGSPGELWLWGHHIGFQYFWDHFEWQMGAGDIIRADINSSYDAPYDGRAKAAVRINGGDWIDITNDNVTCAYPESEQFCIGGVTNAQRFKVDGSQLQSGSNTVEFAFLGHDMLSSGYRILDMVALPAGYDGSLSHRDVRPVDLITNTKVMDYLDTEAPEGSDPIAGEALWNADNSLLDWPGGPEIIASCNDCHAQDGRDLEFFGYSNESITVRSQHHGLTEQEGENIAAFIRSQDLTLEDGTSYDFRSRPWHPPYQPGPAGFGPNNEHPDVADAQFWSAGAGLEWVADSDNEALPYLFDDGTGNPQAGPFVNPPEISIQTELFRIGGENPVNLREVPLDVQLPDWNRWLPIIHPRDALGDDYFFNAEWRGRNPWNSYQDARSNGIDASPRIVSRVTEDSRMAWRSIDESIIIDVNTAWNRNLDRHRRAVMQWAAMKQWEIHHEFHLEDRPARGDTERDVRSWTDENRALFNIASHIAEDGSDAHLDGPPLSAAGRSLSHLWYHYQLLVSASETNTSGQSPIDWNYQEMYMGSFTSETGLPAAVRTLTTIAKKDQILGGKFGLNPSNGFNSHRHGLREMYKPASGIAFSGLDPEIRGQVVGSYLSAWAWFVYQQDIEDFPRCTPIGCDRTVARNYWGDPEDRPDDRTRPRSHGGNNAADNHYASIRWLDNNMDIPETTLDSLARWGSEMWSEPVDSAPGWDTWFLENLPPFALNMAGGSTQLEPASITLTAEPDGTPDEVRFYQDDVLIDTRTGPPWETSVSGLAAGNYNFKAEADSEQETFVSGNRMLEVVPEWVTSRLAQRSRGPVTGTVNLIDDKRLSVTGTGVSTGVRRKFEFNHVEAYEECIDDSEIEFTIADMTAPQDRAWTRAGFQLEGGNADEVYLFEYLPLQRRVRILVAENDQSWFSQEQSITGVDLPIKVRVHQRTVSDIQEITTEYDTTGDGEFDSSHFWVFGDQSEDSTFITTFNQSCNWSLFSTSRHEQDEAEAAFHDVDVIRPIQ